MLEACEAFRALDHWVPSHCLVTNLDDEHVEHYGGAQALKDAFLRLVDRTRSGGVIVLCGDDPGAAALADRRPQAVTTYGLDAANAVFGEVFELTQEGGVFNVMADGAALGEVKLALPGLHNVRNALGVIAMALGLGVPFPTIAAALGEFRGVDRRWQALGDAAGVRVFDDYAHHPAEVDAVLKTARAALGDGGRLVVAFEPQLHSRVRRLAQAFAAALSAADLVLLAPVDGAGETDAHGSADELLGAAILAAGTPLLRAPGLDRMAAVATDQLRRGDLLLTLGPGAISEVGPAVLERLRGGADWARTQDAPSISRGRIVPRTDARGLLGQVLDQAQRRPEATAAACGEERLSYAELVARAGRLASALRAAGVERGDVVAVCLEQSLWRPAAFLGILMAGAVYLPVDPGLPKRRIGFMLRDARAKVLIASGDLRVLAQGASVLLVDPASLPGPGDEAGPPPAALDGAEAAYVIYTSGTTGKPKGVLVEHGALANFARAAAGAFGVGKTSRVSNASAFGFDVAVGETAMTLASGACLVLPADGSARPGAPLGRFVRDTRITHLSLTPSALASLPSYAYPDLGCVIVAGEACPGDLAARWGRGRAFYNAYGPTEATVFATVDAYRPGEELTIGQAMDNGCAFILGEDEAPVGRGEAGELWLSGAGLARGYLRRPELTAERFRTVRAPGGEAVRAYRTGDLAAMLPDGRIRFLGRADDQIKLRGFRIELGEIEACLRACPGVGDAIVDVRKDASGADKLVAYVVAADSQAPPGQDQVRTFVAGRLPPYMVPAATLAIDSAPLTANGKRDRSALPDPPRSAFFRTSRPKPPATPVETALHELFRTELAIEGEFGVRDRLSDLGADSLRTANLFLAVEARFGIELPLEAAANADTIELLALHVEQTLGSPPALADPSRSEPIVRRQLAYLSAWTGVRLRPEALIVTRGDGGERPPLFWCFQGNEEHERLAAELGRRQTLHGMRSGHLVFRYTPDNVAALASRYADEIVALQPEGSIRLGGNCQGGAIAHEIARQLAARGREVALLFLLDQGRFASIGAPVSLIFGADSHLNPYLAEPEPDRIFRAAYAAGYSVDFLPGGHGGYFASPSVEALAGIVSARLQVLDSEARRPATAVS